MGNSKENDGFQKKYPPRVLAFEGKIITSMRTIPNITNKFHIYKINKIRELFSPNNVTPLDIFKKLVPKPKSKFKLPYITIKQKKLIKKLKASNSLGYDNCSIKIYKKVCNRISPHICHLINKLSIRLFIQKF